MFAPGTVECHEVERLRIFEIELQNEIHRARIGTENVLARDTAITHRSVAKLRAWAAIHRAICSAGNGRGLANHLAQAAIASAVPGAPPSTVRSHLHRFKKQGLVEQKST